MQYVPLRTDEIWTGYVGYREELKNTSYLLAIKPSLHVRLCLVQLLLGPFHLFYLFILANRSYRLKSLGKPVPFWVSD